MTTTNGIVDGLKAYRGGLKEEAEHLKDKQSLSDYQKQKVKVVKVEDEDLRARILSL